jgi:hypothetical protein
VKIHIRAFFPCCVKKGIISKKSFEMKSVFFFKFLLSQFYFSHQFLKIIGTLKKCFHIKSVSQEALILPFFYVKMRQNGFFFRNQHEKLGKKMLWKIFLWSYVGLTWGQKLTHTKIDHYTKNGPKSSKLSIFLREKAKMLLVKSNF